MKLLIYKGNKALRIATIGGYDAPGRKPIDESKSAIRNIRPGEVFAVKDSSDENDVVKTQPHPEKKGQSVTIPYTGDYGVYDKANSPHDLNKLAERADLFQKINSPDDYLRKRVAWLATLEDTGRKRSINKAMRDAPAKSAGDEELKADLEEQKRQIQEQSRQNDELNQTVADLKAELQELKGEIKKASTSKK